jgi:small subunit ribosomal protein S21
MPIQADVQSPAGFLGIVGFFIGARKEHALQVLVRDNNIDQALRVLKKKLQREGVFREMKRRRFYEKPSERMAREKGEALRRHRSRSHPPIRLARIASAIPPNKLPVRSFSPATTPLPWVKPIGSIASRHSL